MIRKSYSGNQSMDHRRAINKIIMISWKKRSRLIAALILFILLAGMLVGPASAQYLIVNATSLGTLSYGTSSTRTYEYIHDRTSGSYNPSSAYTGTYANFTSGNWAGIYRVFSAFNTTLPANLQSVNNVTIYFKPTIVHSGLNENLDIVSFSPANPLAISGTDYVTTEWGNTNLSISPAVSTLSVGGWVGIPLKGAGVALINPTGNTTFGVRMSNDTVNISPLWSASAYDDVEFGSTTANMYIVIGYTAPPPIQLLNRDYSAPGGVPVDVGMLPSYEPYQIPNATLAYNSTAPGSLHADWQPNAVGSLTFANLTPCAKTTYTFWVTPHFNGGIGGDYFSFLSSAMKVEIVNGTTPGKLILDQYYYNQSGVPVGATFTMNAGTYNTPFPVTIYFDGANHTYTTTVGIQHLTTNFMDGTPTQSLPYNVISSDQFWITAFPVVGEDDAIDIYNFTQTTYRQGNITPIGDRRIQSFGLDGPETPITVWNNTPAMFLPFGATLTLWVGPGYLTQEPDMIPVIQNLINTGVVELGLHTDFSATLMSEAQAEAMILSNATALHTVFGIWPSSWCSLANNDNTTQAIYAYNNVHGMIWRNSAFNAEDDAFNLDNDTWMWWNLAQNIAAITHTFTHQTNVTPANTYSIDTAKLQQYISGYSAEGYTIMPFYKWYMIEANTNYATFIENTFLPGELANFTPSTNGYPALVEIAIPYTASLYAKNESGGASPTIKTAPDGNAEMYVGNGFTYAITNGGGLLARFTPNTPISVTTQQVIAFTDQSTGTPTSYVWTFGDGTGISGLANVSHFWGGLGYYTVNETVCSGSTCSSNTSWILVYAPQGGY